MNEKEVKRQLAAILSADVKGYSRLMEEDEVTTVRTLEEYRAIMSGLVEKHHGRVVDSPGDNLLAQFASVVDAMEAAVEIQKKLKAQNADLPENRRMEFRIGINLGDVIEEGERIYGDGVNVAARIEGLADGGRDPGGFSGCGTIYKAARDERSLGTFVDDESIEVKIKGRLFDDEQVKWFDISVYCFMGEVFLVGVVEQEAQRVRAVDLAKGVAGVKSVTTYILDKGKDRTTGKSLDDVTVPAKVKAKLNRRQRPEILPDRRKDRQGSCGIVRNRFDPGGDPKGDCPCQAGGGGPEDQVVRDDPLIEGLDPCPQWVWVCPFLGGVSRHQKKATEIFLL